MATHKKGVTLTQDEEDFGLITPSLIKQLRAVLYQYPDSGHILKEIVQNAEDAGATVVKFLYDETQHGADADKLYHPGLAQFQGPSLYAYNNALFREKDWKGIRMLQESVKEKDPLQVGRFGLGFKSVLHLTDLPSIVSGDRLAVIDPHQKYFTFQGQSTTGYSWRLPQKWAELKRIPHQYQPFTGVFDCHEKALAAGKYQGTLFRFPLRQQASELSDNIYTPEKVHSLFTSFQAEAPLLLLFLKHVECVQVLHRKAGMKEPELVFSVELDEACREEVRSKRQKFMANIHPEVWMAAPIQTVYPLTVLNTQNTEDGCCNVTQDRYLVCEYYAGGEASETMRTLHKNQALAHVPLVGVAMTLGVSKPPQEGSEVADGQDDKPNGQVFCFLPLRAEQRTDTGLPVHINGYFSVSQNRHYLNLPSMGQDVKADRSLAWNYCLLTEAVPHAYLYLLLAAVWSVEHNQHQVSPQDVYAAIPNMVEVQEKWTVILEPLFTRLLKKTIFYSGAVNAGRGGQWVPIQDAVFDCMRERPELKKTVKSMLCQAGVHVVDCPRYMLHALGAFSMESPTTVTPDLLRHALQMNPNLVHSCVREHKLHLLEYILKDEDFGDLFNIELLPLATGDFVKFIRQGQPALEVFLPSMDSEKQLLSLLPKQLVSEDLPDGITAKMNKLAHSGEMQVRVFSPDSFAAHLPSMIPKEWFQSEVTHLEPEADKNLISWLDTLWSYLRQHFPSQLTSVSGLPILAVSSDVGINVHALVDPSKIVQSSAMGCVLSPDAQKALQMLGVEIIKELTPTVANHAAVLGMYVRVPLPEDILEAALVAYKTGGKQLLAKFTQDAEEKERHELCEIWSKMVPAEVSSEGLRFLRSLPLFQLCSDEQVQHTSVEEVNIGAPLELPPVATPSNMLDLKSDAARSLARLLGVQPMTMSQYFAQHVFAKPDFLLSNPENMEQTIDYVMDRLPLLIKQDSNFAHHLAELPFVVDCGGTHVKAASLFDPEDELACRFFKGEKVFPGGRYSQSQFLVFLRQLGLKGASNIGAQNVFNSVRSLQHQVKEAEDSGGLVEKGQAILRHLNAQPQQLQEVVEGRSLRDQIRDIAWVPTIQEIPNSYPETLSWHKSPPLVSPSGVFSPAWCPLIGCVAPVMLYEPANSVADLIGWNQPPPLQRVLQQLHEVATCYVSADKPRFLSLITCLYDYLSGQVTEDLVRALQSANLTSWVWHGEGFTSCDKIIIKKCPLDLTPYCFSLPSEIMLYKEMFLNCGSSQEVTSRVLITVLQDIRKIYQEKLEKNQNELPDSNEGSLSDSPAARDLQLAVDVLNMLKAQVNTMDDELRSSILIPIHTEVQGVVHLLPVDECTYCDIEWLRQGFHPLAFDESDGIAFIHPDLPVGTADALGVPTLMSRMLHAEELDVTGLTGFGQGESLTDRLHRLLEDYTDGFAIPKELVQNSDDAGASCIKFLYDERSNQDHMKFLLDDEMKECHGPALWVYNDAVFTDRDFENITKLGGCTKESELDKIGKFGLGFNAVYNITDVPSFLSRNYLVIFDPHTTHVGRAIKDRTKPGIKIDLQKNRTLIRKLPDQFEPYQKVFGCEIACEKDNHFRGTLFRFPLRTKQQAQRSSICSTHYDKYEMAELMKLLVRGAHSLLLFTQNVKSIEVYHLPPEETNPENAVELLRIEKNLMSTLNLTGDLNSSNAVASMLSVGARFMTQVKAGKRAFKKSKIPSATVLLKMSTCITKEGEALTTEKAGQQDQLWIMSSAIGQNQSLSQALEMKDHLVPVASVASPLSRVGDVLVATPLAELGFTGHLFCFLPLPIQTGLPVHINAAFAVQSNRRYLCEHTEDDKHSMKADWNLALLQDAVMLAYEQLLLALSTLPHQGESHYTQLWPNMKDALPAMFPLVQEFYRQLSEGSKIPTHFDSTQNVTLSQAVFLDRTLRDHPSVGEQALQVFRQCSLNGVVLDLPQTIIQSFAATGNPQFISDKTYSQKDFFSQVFFKNIAELEATARDALTCFVLDQNDEDLEILVMSTACIPVTPEGQVLKYPNETIHPADLAAKLYCPEDERFPYGEGYRTATRLAVLEHLGMQAAHLGWNDIIERAESVAVLNASDRVAAMERLHTLLEFINVKITHYAANRSGDAEMLKLELKKASEQLRPITFLPPMEKPKDFPLPWHGDKLEPTTLLAPEDMYGKEDRFLLSCTQYIAEETSMPYRVKHLLGLGSKQCPIELVLTQLEHALQVDLQKLTDSQYETLSKVCYLVYKHLQDKCKSDEQLAECITNTFRDRECILLGRRFVKPSETAFHLSSDCSPYLHVLPPDTATRFKDIMVTFGVTDKFAVKNFAIALQEMKVEHDGILLTGKTLKTSLNLVHQLDSSMADNDLSMEKVKEAYGEIYIPDSRGVLQESSSLCYNDCPWLGSSKDMNFTHRGITATTSSRLGVKTKRQEALTKHAEGIPFGQKENLVGSLRRVLKSYPCDHDILKEFVQNADDAGATEIHFIMDGRSHPANRVFESSWKPLQGPALCVYNNSSFSLADLEGIQRLGEGSKNYDPNKTGEYGLGFSSVYHLSDAPSLLTRGDELGHTLCVFDPMCKYVPGATLSEPGMRFTDLDSLRAAFPDAFRGYLEEHFHEHNSTLFRLPLRNAEMARSSTISQQPITLRLVQDILGKLQREAFDILLFTNNLNQLSISDVNMYSGQLDNTYVIQARLSKEDEQRRSEFYAYVRSMGKKLRDGLIGVEEIELKDVMYDVTLCDNQGREELWRITQRIGLEKGQSLPNLAQVAFNRGDLCLLPRGGTACLMERKVHGNVETDHRPRRVFCYLPLPLETHLPVHINGHFALGYENRRHLWNNKGDHDYKQAWNDFLFQDIISPCYLKLLYSLRLHCLQIQIDGDKTEVSCIRGVLDSAIKTYQEFFPCFDAGHSQWDVLVKAVFTQSAEQDLALLPSVKELQAAATHIQVPKWQVLWLPPCGKGTQKAFFAQIEDEDPTKESQASVLSMFKSLFRTSPTTPEKTDTQILKDLLLDCGFKILEATPSVQRGYQEAGVDIQFMSPAGVNMFFQSCTSDEPMGNMGEFPSPLYRTLFVTTKTLQIVLKFCKNDEEFMSKLEGMPLCLTADNVLRIFSSEAPVFPSDQRNLVPQCADQFLHPSISDFFKDVDPVASPVFKKLALDSLSSMLPKQLDPAVYCQSSAPVQWKMRYNSFPNDTWLRAIWCYIQKETEAPVKTPTELKQEWDEESYHDAKDEEEEQSQSLNEGTDAKSKMTDVLAPLSDWCLVPATCRGINKLYPICKAQEVVDLRRPSSVTAAEFLKRIGVPQLDASSLDIRGSSSTSDFVRRVTTTLNDPLGVLDSVTLCCQAQEKLDRIDLSKGGELLRYFSKNMGQLAEHPEALEKLRALPLYLTIHGDIIQLTGCFVYTLPATIPTADMDVWHSKSGTVFLKHDDALEAVYHALGCVAISGLEAYCKFILQHFELISPAARLTHLHHLYVTYLYPGNNKLNEEDTDHLLACLRDLSFLEDSNGDLCPASDFYDPENELFSVIKSQQELPPRAAPPFRESEWLSLLRMIGLQSQVTKVMCVEFAQQIAHQAKDQSNASALAKSKVMVQHLFRMQDRVARDEILNDVSTLPFVQPEQASDHLRYIYTQYGDMGDGSLPFVSFKDSFSKDDENLVWTAGPLLPAWADPSKQHGISQQDCMQIQECLAMHKRPPIDLVLHHMKTLCRHLLENKDCLPEYSTLVTLFKPIYKYLSEHLEVQDAEKLLCNVPCVLVRGEVPLTVPRYTVLNLVTDDEIQPYLFRVPAELGEFHQLFSKLGMENVATVDQYASVLERINHAVEGDILTANELRMAYRAIRGLFEALEKTDKKSILSKSLYLPDEEGKLLEVSQLIFNDAPAYYERVQELGIHFLFELRECGIHHRHIEELLNRLPNELCPGKLSEHVKETLVKSCKDSVTNTGLAAKVGSQLRCEAFLSAVARLARHEAYKSGSRLDDATMYDALDRLTTVHVWGVDRLQTHLVYNGRPIPGSHVDKSCFIEKLRADHEPEMWNIFLRQEPTLSQDLLIVLAEALNSILGGILKDSALFLLPLINCNQSDMQARLDMLNVRIDRSYATARQPTLPTAGSAIPNYQKQWISPNCGDSFQPGEYIAYKENHEADFVYAVVKEFIYTEKSPENGGHYYYVQVRADADARCVVHHKMYKIDRNA